MEVTHYNNNIKKTIVTLTRDVTRAIIVHYLLFYFLQRSYL